MIVLFSVANFLLEGVVSSTVLDAVIYDIHCYVVRKDGYKRSFCHSCRQQHISASPHINIADERTIEAVEGPCLVPPLI
jgi:hypothetical protein